MEISVLNSSLIKVGVLDVIESFIWTDRYYGFGDFVIVGLINSNFLGNLNGGVYLKHTGSDRLMVIEPINIKTDVESGNKITVKGRSLESILYRRIVWSPTILDGNFQTEIQRLLNENAISPSNADRDISRLEFEASVDPVITALTVNSPFYGEFLYKAIYDLCLEKKIGFKVTLTDVGNFKFKLYAGVNRSHDQVINPYVVFSPNYENLLNSDYIEDDTYLRTVTLAAGEEGVGNARRTVTVPASGGAGTDLARREMFTDAKDITRSMTGGEPLTDEQYDALLTQRGQEELSKNISIKNFDGQIDNNTKKYVYEVDYFLGDLVQVTNEYGYGAKSRVIEMIYSEDASGIKMYPTFGVP